MAAAAVELAERYQRKGRNEATLHRFLAIALILSAWPSQSSQRPTETLCSLSRPQSRQCRDVIARGKYPFHA
jgi:hypothetical protein